MYYVYKLINPLTNKIFYVGKGSGDRAYSHQKFKDTNNNKHKDATIRQILDAGIDVIVEFEHKDILDESKAYFLEEKLIQEIGLQNLTNITPNSRPPSRKGKKVIMSESHRLNISRALYGKKKSTLPWNKGLTKETDNRLKKLSENRAKVGNSHQIGKQRDPETIKKIKDRLTGRSMTPEQIDKMSSAKKGKTWEEIYGIEGAQQRRIAIKKRKGKK
jgi:hypothetical protein